MPPPSQTLDIWIVESNVVYKGVPFAVVADWVQQGRLLEDDRVRAPQAADWVRLSLFPSLAAYLPRPEPFRADDRAEALEPVELDFTWKRRRADEEEDVDMIPLIDVSLVLLIFFMMTATVAGAGGLIPTPKTRNVTGLASTPYWIGINCPLASTGRPEREPNGDYVLVYSMGEGEKPADTGAQNLATRDELLQQLDRRISPGDRVEVRIKAHPLLPYEIIRDLTVALEPRRSRGQISKLHAEVSKRENR